MNTNLTNALAARIAKTEGIHFLRARNRVALAVEIAETVSSVTLKGALTNSAFRSIVEGRVGRPVSDDTLRLAREIAA